MGETETEKPKNIARDDLGSCIRDIIGNTVPEIILMSIINALSRGVVAEDYDPEFKQMLDSYWIISPATVSSSVMVSFTRPGKFCLITIKSEQDGKLLVDWLASENTPVVIFVPVSSKAPKNLIDDVGKWISGLRSRLHW